MYQGLLRRSDSLVTLSLSDAQADMRVVHITSSRAPVLGHPSYPNHCDVFHDRDMPPLESHQHLLACCNQMIGIPQEIDAVHVSLAPRCKLPSLGLPGTPSRISFLA